MALTDFTLNSDTPIDTLVIVDSGSFTVPNFTFDTITIYSHSFTFIPLPLLFWSNTPDFEITNFGADEAYARTYFSGGGVGQTYTPTGTSNGVTLNRTNSSGSTKTVYWRLIAFPPSTADPDAIVPFTANQGSDFILNSENNYMKLFDTGALTVGNPVYSHNLGIVPTVFTWGDYTPSISMQEINPDTGVESSGVIADENNLTWFRPNSFTSIEFRLYVEPQ